ncbi:MAG: sodium ion-translocating decarboxylase subunit beta [Opitutales bacterium]|nr:sodium ion-translocating decarboxylase subunit beta [Opitutales bacterium]
MEIDFVDIVRQLFQGITTLVDSDPTIFWGRICLIFLGALLAFLGKKGVLEPLLMIPMGLGMVVANTGVLYIDSANAVRSERITDARWVNDNDKSDVRFFTLRDDADFSERTVLPEYITLNTKAELENYVGAGSLKIRNSDGQELSGKVVVPGDLNIEPLVEQPDNVVNLMQVDWIQPIYNYAFSNNLIACLIFMGIGVLLDVGFLMARPFQSVFVAFCAELGTMVTFPVAIACGLGLGEAASVALIGGADGPMVLFGSLQMAKHLFVPITVVAYLYLGITYGAYPFLVRFLVPETLRRVRNAPPKKVIKVTASEKIAFAVTTCGALCLLFPVGSPLFCSLFVGIAVREAGIQSFVRLIDQVFLYGATFFLGLILGLLCSASTLLSEKVLILLVLGIFALTISAVGGILGGYIMYLFSGRRFNPVCGIAGISCVPTCAKIAQKEVSRVAPDVIVLPDALGINISGVITSAIFTGVYIALVPQLQRLWELVQAAAQ